MDSRTFDYDDREIIEMGDEDALLILSPAADGGVAVACCITEVASPAVRDRAHAFMRLARADAVRRHREGHAGKGERLGRQTVDRHTS